MLQSGFATAQTGIGTKKPDESSVLDIDSKERVADSQNEF
jgi:hypothetical protein